MPTFKSRKIFVVGDFFREFAKISNVVTFGDLLKIIKKYNRNRIFEYKYQVHIGQGINLANINTLTNILDENGIRDQFKIHCPNQLKHKEHKKFVIKHNDKDVLISIPQKTGKNEYTSHFLIDPDSSYFANHSGRLHIDGALLIQGAIQMITAVNIRYYIPTEREPDFAFTVSKIDTTLFQYAVPIDIVITQRVESIKKRSEGNFRMRSLVTLSQYGQKLCEVSIHGISYDKSYIVSKQVNNINGLLARALADGEKQKSKSEVPSTFPTSKL